MIIQRQPSSFRGCPLAASMLPNSLRQRSVFPFTTRTTFLKHCSTQWDRSMPIRAWPELRESDRDRTNADKLTVRRLPCLAIRGRREFWNSL